MNDLEKVIDDQAKVITDREKGHQPAPAILVAEVQGDDDHQAGGAGGAGAAAQPPHRVGAFRVEHSNCPDQVMLTMYLSLLARHGVIPLKTKS